MTKQKIKLLKTIVASLCCLALSMPLHAQDWKSMDSDELFAVARAEIFDGSRAEGQIKLKYILEKIPAYDDVRILLARTFSWDGLYAEARKELQVVLKTNANSREAIDALIDVELWSGHNEDALRVAAMGLARHASNENFLFKEATALHTLGRDREALNTLMKLLKMNPGHKRGTELHNQITRRDLKYTAGISYGTDFFSRVFDPAHSVSAQISRANSWGATLLRFNHAERFNSFGSQWEIDLYPKIINGIYAYISYGYSESKLFPKNRLGSELYFKLPKSLEMSAGARYMHFDRSTQVVIYTGSVGWYIKNYWLSARTYITPDPEIGTTSSAAMTLRRYFAEAENFVGFHAGMGFSPDLGRIQNGTGLSENEIYSLKSQRGGLTWQNVFHATWILNLSAEVAKQELAFQQKDYVLITSALISIRKRL